MLPKAYRKELENKIKNYAKINFISPKQTKKLLKLDYDTDFLEDKIFECLKTPDITYLQKLFIQDFNSQTSTSKNITDMSIFNAIAIGDIIGSKYEFTEHDYDDIDEDDLVSDASRYTDDTVLAYATLSAINESPKRPNFRVAYVAAYERLPDAGYGSSFIRWAKGDEISNRVGYGSFANGSAMRVATIGCHYKNVKDVIKNAIKSAMVTHNHQDGIKGAVVTAVVVWMAKNGYSKDDIKKYVNKFYNFSKEEQKYLFNKEVYFDLSSDLNALPNTMSKNSIFCNYAVPFAIKCFLETNSYKDCMIEILRHYGDTDTICAIAGGICYAYYGEINLSQDDMRKAECFIDNFQLLA